MRSEIRCENSNIHTHNQKIMLAPQLKLLNLDMQLENCHKHKYPFQAFRSSLEG